MERMIRRTVKTNVAEIAIANFESKVFDTASYVYRGSRLAPEIVLKKASKDKNFMAEIGTDYVLVKVVKQYVIERKYEMTEDMFCEYATPVDTI